MPETDEKEKTWEDHLAAAIKSFRKEMKERRMDMFPEDFYVHRRAARREMLLAWRSMIDARITKLDEEEKEKASPQAERIKVE